MTTKDTVQQLALESVLKFRRSGVVLSVGAGKTKLGLMYLNKVGGKTLILVPKLDIIKSWQDDAIKFNYEHVMENVTFSTYLSLKKHDLPQFQNIVMDEAHNLLLHQDKHLAQYLGNILGLTGTPPRQQDKKIMMDKYYPIRYTFKMDTAVEAGMLNDYRIYVHKLDLSTVKNLPVKNFMVSERSNYEYASKRILMASTDKSRMFAHINRVNVLKQCKTKERYTLQLLKQIPDDEKCIVFANTIEQAEKLCSYSHHSQMDGDYLNAFKDGLITRLSCVEQLSEGINISALKHAIVLHTFSASSPKARQKLGRMMRLPTDETSHIHILCYKDTVDEKWVEDVLKDFDESKITYVQEAL
jgi:superfamily II DNA or RNA helicase